jgi:hypothetical protein
MKLLIWFHPFFNFLDMSFKNIFVLFTFLFVFIHVSGQTFSKNIEGIHEGIKGGGYITELSDQNILISTNPYFLSQAEVVLLNNDGVLIDKTYLDYYITDIFEISHDSILIIGGQGIDSTKSCLAAIIINYNLDIVSIDTIHINYTIINTAKLLFHNNQYYYFGSFKSGLGSPYSRITAGTIDKKGKFAIRTDFTIPNTGVAHIQGHPNGDVLLFQAGSLIYTFDKDFNYKSDYLFQDSDIFDHADSFWANDSSFIISGSTYVGDQRCLKTRLTDACFNVKKEVIYESPFVFNYAGIYSNLVSVNNGFFLAGTKNVGFIAFPIDTIKSLIYVVKSDNKLNKIWEKQIGGDARYVVYSVASTKNNGILILATRYDPDKNGDNANDIFLIKMDENGDYSKISLNEKVNNNCVIYPNPFNDYFKVVSKDKKINKILIYNTNGQVIFSMLINDNEIIINTNSFEKGTYLISIFFNNMTNINTVLIKQ